MVVEGEAGADVLEDEVGAPLGDALKNSHAVLSFGLRRIALWAVSVYRGPNLSAIANRLFAAPNRRLFGRASPKEIRMSITLYAAPMSSATPVVIALAELEVPHELVNVDLSREDQRRPEFLALNPNGKVPTLVVDGTAMFEALAIMQWLGDRFGVERGLWPPADAPERIEALSWSTWAYVTFTSTLQRLNHAASEQAPAQFHNSALAKHSHEELQTLLSLLEARLASQPYLLGDSFSLADLIVASVITWATFCGVPVDDHARVKTWLQRFHERPAYKRTWVGAA